MDLAAIAGNWDWLILSQILGVNIVLSGDNAVLIALAAAGLPAEKRAKAIMFGMVLAVILRVVLSIAAVQLLAIPGLLLLGGALLLWIAWGFFQELRSEDKDDESANTVHEEKTLGTALRQIVIADVSMSLDNVLAVAGAAGGNMPMLILGLLISILLMGVAATLISKLLERYRWIAYVGVALIVYIGVKMIYEDVHRLWERFGPGHAMLHDAGPMLAKAATLPLLGG
ncbi:YjbE family putative metal transport protein [Siccirubricoccus sp. KC 17139]|uniref:YjbE family putative metal transport protein n=1 Tax=Siccirubricoccus soli TaxID=2899147 RepID=A0ABT1D230_9PROT|nr:YjbE family putative metal transport protein [Siccirubricoccus soli]MCO6415974.1 YjbE family putative metal transport protein [Siccirubricoccus soli]MCP2682106.1 YjbE family putative metal transport protein [Siccirubricoccus soli]